MSLQKKEFPKAMTKVSIITLIPPRNTQSTTITNNRSEPEHPRIDENRREPQKNATAVPRAMRLARNSRAPRAVRVLSIAQQRLNERNPMESSQHACSIRACNECTKRTIRLEFQRRRVDSIQFLARISKFRRAAMHCRLRGRIPVRGPRVHAYRRLLFIVAAT